MQAFYFNKLGLSPVAHDAEKVKKVHLWADVKATKKNVYENEGEGFVIAENYKEACKMYLIHNYDDFEREYTYEAAFNPVTNKYDVVLIKISDTIYGKGVYSKGVYCENLSAKVLTGFANATSALQAVKLIEDYIAKNK